MIVFMDYSVGNMTGGELYNKKLYSFFKDKYYDLYPEKLVKLPEHLYNPIKHMYYERDFIKRKKPDIIVIDIYSGIRNILAAREMKRNGKVVICIVQGLRLKFRYNLNILRYIIRIIEKYLIKNSDIIIANSDYLYGYVRKIVSPRQQIILCKPGLKVIADNYDYCKLIEERNKNKFELLFVGSWGKVKGTIVAVKAMKLLTDLDIKLNIVGNYSESDRYYKKGKKFLSKYNLNDRVKIHGYLESNKLVELYKRCSLFIMPSLFEGYGIALAEAISFGLPVVASKVGAIPDLINENVNGFLIKPGDYTQLANAIKKLYFDVDLRNKLGENNRKDSKKLSTWDSFNSALINELIPAINNKAGITPKDILK